jgi:hypothetical protein
MNNNPTAGFATGAAAGVATAYALDQAYEKSQNKLTGLGGDCSSIRCKDKLVCYKNKCLDSLPKNGCIKDSDCKEFGEKCTNDTCIQTLSEEEKRQKLEEIHQSQKKLEKGLGITFGVFFGVSILIAIVLYFLKK